MAKVSERRDEVGGVPQCDKDLLGQWVDRPVEDREPDCAAEEYQEQHAECMPRPAAPLAHLNPAESGLAKVINGHRTSGRLRSAPPSRVSGEMHRFPG